MTHPVDLFKDTFHRLNATSLHLLTGLYSEQVVFQDPFRRLEGLPALRRYFAELYRHTTSSAFVFEQEFVGEGSAMLTWTMSVRHPRLRGGRLIHVTGATRLGFHDKIIFHRDYFDAGELIYEHLPLLGPLVRAIKRRV